MTGYMTSKLAFLAALSLAAAEAPDRFQIPFQRVVVDATPYPHSDCKGAGDIDGDGKPDIVLGGSELAWYRWPDWKRTRIAAAEKEFSTDMQVADVDGDGDLDIIVPDGPQGKIYWYENPRPKGDPARDPWRRHLIGTQGSFVHDLEVGDVNGDGKLDILTRKKSTIVWLQQTPDSFERVEIATAMPSGEGSALADLNGDGRLDIVQNGYWLECPPDAAHGTWAKHEIDPHWPRQLAITVADMDQDGRLDVLIGPAESHGKLSWYENPDDLSQGGKWIEHVIDDDVDYLHTFKVADVNHDGLPDVVTAEMHQSPRRRVTVYFRESSKKWRPQVIATSGSHNLRLADIGGDGDIDIIGANWGGSDRSLVVWENQLVDRARMNMDAAWSYTQVDARRAKWGDFDKPRWMKYFGLAFADVDGDGFTDIASGRYFYRNPGREGAPWQRVDVGFNVDASLALKIGGRMALIGQALPDLYLLRPMDRAGTKWERTRIGSVPPTEHVNSQGYRVARLFGSEQSVLVAGGDGIYCFTVPAHPGRGEWAGTRIAPGTSEEGIAVGDFGGHHRTDIAVGEKDGHTIYWWANPGRTGLEWSKHFVGKTERWADRFAAADINGDGRTDIVVSEESAYAPGSVYWFEQPANPDGEWVRHTLVTQYTTNSLDVADVNGDGAPDIVTGEHRGSRKLAWWENRGHGAAWTEHVIDTGKENHLGARVFRFDRRGRLAIASIAWDTYPMLHVWVKK